jgi:hypothetical protein
MSGGGNCREWGGICGEHKKEIPWLIWPQAVSCDTSLLSKAVLDIVLCLKLCFLTMVGGDNRGKNAAAASGAENQIPINYRKTFEEVKP